MKRIALLLFSALFAVCPLTAQTGAAVNDPPFWTDQDAVVKDANGKIIAHEVRDRKNYTLQTFGEEGKWKATYHFTPHTDHIAYVESPETNEQYLYDKAGRVAGYTIRMGTLSFTGSATSDGVLSAPGLPTITLHRDAYERLVGVSIDQNPAIATYLYDSVGYLRGASFDGYALALTAPVNGLVTETLTGRHGELLHQAQVSGDKHDSKQDCSLDVVADDFNLGRSWATRVAYEDTSTSTVTKVHASNGPVFLYLMRVGPHRIAFDAKGHAVFYVINTNLPSSFGHMPGAETTYNPIVEQSAVIPQRLVITADGRVGACVVGASSGAIASLWTKHDGGGHLFYRTETPSGASTNPTSSTSITTEPQATRRTLRGGMSSVTAVLTRLPPAPQSFYVCGTETVCDTCEYCAPDGSDGTTCGTVDEMCSDGVSGGGDGSGGGGGGGGGTSNNNTTGTLQVRVSTAETAAAAKLANQTCSGFLGGLYALNGYTLSAMLSGKAGAPAGGWTFQSFLLGNGSGGGLIFVNGYTSGLCSGATAHTALYDNTVSICDSFNNLTTNDAAVRLIHEELHALGYPENPPYSSAQTPATISAMVAAHCP